MKSAVRRHGTDGQQLHPICSPLGHQPVQTRAALGQLTGCNWYERRTIWHGSTSALTLSTHLTECGVPLVHLVCSAELLTKLPIEGVHVDLGSLQSL